MTQEQEWRENEGEPMARLEEERQEHMIAVPDAHAAYERLRAFDRQGGGL